MDSYGFSSDMFSGRAVLGEDSSVMARMQKKFWKTKQVLIKATGKKEDEHVVASDADLDAKLGFFRSVQSTCTELLRVIEKYQQRITHLSQEENELGLFLRFQAEHDKTKAGSMMDATSKALCCSAKQRLALCPPLHRMEQEVDTFRRRAIADTLLTVSRMEKARTEYRGALLWMKDVSQELDPDTYKQLEKFRKVQAQVRGTKVQFDKLKNDVCQKVDMLGASRCNMVSHSLCTYQTTLLQYWEKTAHIMSGIHDAFKGYVPYQFTTLKELRDPLDQITSEQPAEDRKEKGKKTHPDNLVSLEDEQLGESSETVSTRAVDGQSRGSDSSLCASLDSALNEQFGHFDEASTDDDLLFMTSDPAPIMTPIPSLTPTLAPTLNPAMPALQPHTLQDATAPPTVQWDLGASHLEKQNALISTVRTEIGRDLLSEDLHSGEVNEEEGERGDLSFLQDLLSPGATVGTSEFSQAWQDAFGCFEAPPTPVAPDTPASSQAETTNTSTGFLPSQLLDQSLHATGWATPPMFQAPPLQPPPIGGQAHPAQNSPNSLVNAAKGSSRDMSAWFNLFADLDPLSNPDAIGRSDQEILSA
ncbi:islet cell autoantigen 1-like protein isoform X1 [Xyrauchen texanus]|uniref:islet cell autoantigen 1-like protein isoform X1 n=1 Tax=Xyrauchen texanus TaxID=154827 RepID=UPI0022421945|nr:islet cell autoantigen 1-like protein isoform X1 [Xyrauchen texanus]XP_051997012.1 islet cell autoantigen 1-like protein isoform X1 [Xyrauchen texanus]XP_051997013.1 islet cell autoantigen 1-like protein isoform X1 [Xyrauchen texanus]XP_051997014.1 islet cell autoantigen 1-like protein isoform X1 [Xyrauchen texanus]